MIEQGESKVGTIKQTVQIPPKKPKFPRTFALIMACVASGFLGAWIFVATGLMRPDASQTLTDNRQTLVLQQGEIVSDVFKKVSPSTVAVTTQTVDTSNRYRTPRVSEGAGSGVIVSKDGYVLTNKHVVPAGTGKVTVVLADGKQYDNVKIIGRDPTNDLAFLKIEGVNDLTPAIIGDSSKVEPGQQVVAIGNALGLFRNSVTSGIISGLGRPIQTADEATGTPEQLEDMLQTDAAINPGNSGGPLVNLKGEVIGINTAVSQNGQGISFAIPINAARGLIDSVTKTGKIDKAYLGVSYIGLTPDIAEQFKLSAKNGALVYPTSRSQVAVLPNSPAAKAGLRQDDIITKINDQQITPESSLASKLSQFKPGDEVQLTVMRGTSEQTIKVTLASYPQ